MTRRLEGTALYLNAAELTTLQRRLERDLTYWSPLDLAERREKRRVLRIVSKVRAARGVRRTR